MLIHPKSKATIRRTGRDVPDAVTAYVVMRVLMPENSACTCRWTHRGRLRKSEACKRERDLKLNSKFKLR